MHLHHSGVEPALHANHVKNLSSATAGTIQQPTREIETLLCFSHLRWDFVYQRPQHLISRASSHWRVYFWEEPVWDKSEWLEVRPITEQLQVIVPHLLHGTNGEQATALQRRWLNQFLTDQSIKDYMSWYYTPMAWAFTNHLQPVLTVYDCMDELSAFKGAPPQLRDREKLVMEQADLMFTGGYSLFESKKTLHSSVHAFPSSIDYSFFAQARQGLPDPADQQHLATPRIGYSGVIDERFDIELLRTLAQRRPDWQFVLLGPVVKINPATLPKGPNLHYLGMKRYTELPAYFSNWQAAMLPFAHNESTKFISPTKTPEYLAAGLPVISTSIRDVVQSYGDWDPVFIADSADDFEKAIEAALKNREWLDWTNLDAWLTQQSWEQTWRSMYALIQNNLKAADPIPMPDRAPFA